MNKTYNMKKVVRLTESDLVKLVKRFVNETIGEKLQPQSLSSPKAEDTKKIAKLLNTQYKLNLSAADTGSWTDKDYNDTLLKFLKEKGFKYGVCQKGDGYCSDQQVGEVYSLDPNFRKMVNGGGNTTQPNSTDKINNTHDKSYDYKLSNGNYYYSVKGKNSWVLAKGKGLESIKNNVKF